MESLGKGIIATGAGVGFLILAAAIFGAGCNGHVFEVMQIGSIGEWVASICILLGIIGIGAGAYGVRNLKDAWKERQIRQISKAAITDWTDSYIEGKRRR